MSKALDPAHTLISTLLTNFFQVVRMGADNTVAVMERAIEAGHSVLIENMGESIDAVLNPVITRSTFKKGRNLYVKLGDKEVEYNKNFKVGPLCVARLLRWCGVKDADRPSTECFRPVCVITTGLQDIILLCDLFTPLVVCLTHIQS